VPDNCSNESNGSLRLDASGLHPDTVAPARRPRARLRCATKKGSHYRNLRSLRDQVREPREPQGERELHRRRPARERERSRLFRLACALEGPHFRHRHRIRRQGRRPPRPQDAIRPSAASSSRRRREEGDGRDHHAPALRPRRQLRLFPSASFHLQDERWLTRPAATWLKASSTTPTKRARWPQWCARCTRGACASTTATRSSRRPLAASHRRAHEGLQAVRVHTRIGWIVLASDAAHLYANMNETRPFPIVFDAGAMVEGYRACASWADAPELVVPGHDPLVMRRYAAPSAELEGIAVRLDGGRSPKPERGWRRIHRSRMRTSHRTPNLPMKKLLILLLALLIAAVCERGRRRATRTGRCAWSSASRPAAARTWSRVSSPRAHRESRPTGGDREPGPGATGTVAAAMVAKSPPTLHLMMGHVSVNAIAPSLFPNLPYDVAKGLRAGDARRLRAAFRRRASLASVNSIRELIAYSKGRPGELSFPPGQRQHAASRGRDLQEHGGGESRARALQGQRPVDGGPACRAAPGRVRHGACFGGLRALGKNARARRLEREACARVSEVPTVAEPGCRATKSSPGTGLRPRRNAAAIVNRLHAGIAKAMEAPGTRARLAEAGADGTVSAARGVCRDRALGHCALREDHQGRRTEDRLRVRMKVIGSGQTLGATIEGLDLAQRCRTSSSTPCCAR